MISERIEDWTYEKIKELVTNDINESEKHDSKSGLPPPIELTKDCCAFANSKGGFIILGITESGRKFRIEGINRDKDLANDFGHKLKALPTNPRFDLAPFIPIPDSNKVLAVIEIPKSSHGPFIPADKDQRIFWKRTNTGNEQMSYDEIKEAFQELLKKPDFTKNEIRFRILFVLYMNNISEEPGCNKLTRKRKKIVVAIVQCHS
jgi:predicted HTH transcriptional regulator